MFKTYVVAMRVFAMPRNWTYCLLHGVKYDASWRFCGLPIIDRRRGAIIKIGRCFKACSDPKWNSLGVFQKVTIKAGMPGSKIEIGDNVGVSGCTIAASKSITVGNRVLIGSGALITDSDAHPLDWRVRQMGGCGKTDPVVIEDDVFIGARAMILKGVRLGRGCVIGAGAVVTHDVPPEKIYAGNPAREIGEIK